MFTFLYLQFDLDVYACGHIQLHQRVHCLCRGVDDIYQSLVGPLLELLSGILVLVNSS